MMELIRLLCGLLLEALYPAQANCMGCGSPAGAEEGWLCGDCAHKFRRIADAPGPRCPRCGRPEGGRRCETCGDWPEGLIDAARFVFAYRRPVSGMIRRMKYQGVARMAGWMAAEMGEAVRRELPGGFDLVVFVPMHRRRQRMRGGNHAEAIARALAVELGLPVSESLVRVRDTQQQARLHAAARRVNLEGAFQAAADVSGRRVLLVDDVLTTGATALACAGALRTAGARGISFIALAGAVDRTSHPLSNRLGRRGKNAVKIRLIL